MELKQYQREVLDDLALYIDTLNDCGRLDTAFAKFWSDKGINVAEGNDDLHPYRNDVRSVPNVTVKVPTAGGKTFIACNALRTILDNYQRNHNQVVVWLVPSDTILTQTYNNLSNPLHPYRQRINTLFNNAVQVVDKEAALAGNGIDPTSISEQLTIFVLGINSFIEARRVGKPRAHRENGNLNYGLPQPPESRIENVDETSLLQYIANLNPVVIIDESHNFETNLRFDLLNNINPRFILDLTATPREKSNIISFVDAIKLKRENMVKLPVIVSNCVNKNDVIIKAIALQRNLEQQAIEEHRNGGKYIRPIVLFQAEPRTANDTVTYEKIKQDLIESGIPQEYIKIKTGDKNELINVDLLSQDCPVRYIITVNALKEGWDCPFAYVLATIANRSSRVDVEQILGRILRQPYTRQHQHELLNMSYVFTCSNQFEQTIQDIVTGLNHAGFSSRDYRAMEPANEPTLTTPEPTQAQLFAEKSFSEPAEPTIEPSDDMDIDTARVKAMLESPQESHHIVEAIAQRAVAVNQEYNQQVKQAEHQGDAAIPTELMSRVRQYRMRDMFASDVQQITIPTFWIQSNRASLFSNANEWYRLTQEELLTGFDLNRGDKKIDFPIELSQGKIIDLDERQRDEYVPVARTFNDRQIEYFKRILSDMPDDKKVESVAADFARELSKKENTVSDRDLMKYVRDVLENRSGEELSQFLDNKERVIQIIRDKIQQLKDEYVQGQFEKQCNMGKIECRADFKFPQVISFTENPVLGIDKSLYVNEQGNMNNLELNVIGQIASLDNVKFWHRNLGRGKGFCINGFRHDHYPDFIVVLKSGKVILVETKGDDRDNSDSRYKIKIGQRWENLAGSNYRYYMVFKDSAPIEGSVSVKDLLSRLRAM